MGAYALDQVIVGMASRSNVGFIMPVYNRRTLVRGAAWSIPVVALSAHAPAFAASTDPPVPGSFVACKQPGGPNSANCQGYRIAINFTVSSGASYSLAFTEVKINGVAAASYVPTGFTVGPGANVHVLNVCTKDSSGDKPTLTFRYTATNLSTGAVSGTLGGVYKLDVTENCS